MRAAWRYVEHLIDLGIGLWLTEPTAKAYALGLKAQRQTRRDHCLRAGSPCYPYRLRTRSRPRELRPDSLGLNPPQPPCERKPLKVPSQLCSPCQAERGRRAGSDAVTAMADHRGYAAPSLAPGPSPPRQPERRQMTRIPRSHTSAWAPGTHHASSPTRNQSEQHPHPRMSLRTPNLTLTRPTAS